MESHEGTAGYVADRWDGWGMKQIEAYIPLQVCQVFQIERPTLMKTSGGLEVASWPLVPKFVGLNPVEAFGFLRANKNPQHVGGH